MVGGRRIFINRLVARSNSSGDNNNNNNNNNNENNNDKTIINSNTNSSSNTANHDSNNSKNTSPTVDNNQANKDLYTNSLTGVVGPPECPPDGLCCNSGCNNCVWLVYADELLEYFKDGGEKAMEGLKGVPNADVREFLKMELRMKIQLKKYEEKKKK